MADLAARRRIAQEHLHSEDRVAVEATTNTWPVVELLGPFVAEIVVSNPMRTAAIAEDKVDAATLRAQYLPGVWPPDAVTAQLRQLIKLS